MIEKNTKFGREERYLVLKYKDLEKIPTELLLQLHGVIQDIGEHVPERKYVCIEDDWPEYEIVWKMIEDRMTDDREKY